MALLYRLDSGILLEELVERPYITAGFAGLVLMLAAGSDLDPQNAAQAGVNWTQLHRLSIRPRLLACMHLLWQARSDIGEPLAYMLVFALLLVWRSDVIG